MIKLTAQRQAILDMINASDRHWDADELARSLSDNGQPIGIATVYRGLATLEAAGLIESIQLADKKRYERADKAHHDHMICTVCGDIEEFAHAKIESLQLSVAAEKGFTVTGHQLVMFGLCERCSQGEQK
ncbi:Fur family transcriptional regulator [Mariprofundus ferrooxydans]|uniref:Ferric uptake regulation protein n=1 Tax=Mariprofundus ferrooxydans PV-1 TaxID=314345 RepID=Q0F0K1_9PROT|nr:transcriptional repressor [Mariprofundus ferrooxydans]EAU55027.1 Possible Ferric uptake regulator (FUR) family protein [Mariprofundus ferrooxydans PV-1]KON48435.1 Fur family transcriptional regulator [Mariprofundus ferrooxydans]